MLNWRVGYRRQSEGQNKQSHLCYTGVLDIEGSLRAKQSYLCYTGVLDIEGSLRAKTELYMLYWRVGGYRRQSEGKKPQSYLLYWRVV